MPSVPRFHWKRFLFASLLATGTLAHADDPTPVAPPGTKLVRIGGSKGGYIAVKDAPDPFKNVSSNLSDSTTTGGGFNATSSFANKAYDTGDAENTKDSAYQKGALGSFQTKSYFTNSADGADKSTPGLDSKYPVSPDNDYSHAASGYDKSFSTAPPDGNQMKLTSYATSTASEQGHTAVLGGHDIPKYASDWSSKTYQGPEVRTVKNDLERLNEGMESMKDLPNRTLTIDEVRALINHGVKPDLDDKAAAPSKALNDPDYTPDPAPPPLHESAESDHAGSSVKESDNDDDAPPPPGTMAAPQPEPPENTEPLPQ